ncbi:hypothetical protein [Thalassotalea sediminis]|uniref:hypothetical protein n=1 Tax=Thalassotalea sediminis TaxID=1759089 RepID=UPI0025729006|nr:hypothetical protein [Thalassotalea sediminis]
MTEKSTQGKQITSVSISDIETPILNGNYKKAEQALVAMMRNQAAEKMEFDLRPKGRNLSVAQKDLESYQIIEKLATLLTKMLSDPNYKAGEALFHEFLVNKKFMSFLFSASSYQNTDHIVRNLGLDKKNQFSLAEVKKLLVLYMPDSTFELPWVQLIPHLPADIARAYIGLISSAVLNLSPTSFENLNRLTRIAKDLPTLSYKNPQNLELMSSGYFHVSNLTGEGKNEFKKWAVRNYTAFMDKYLSSKIKQTIANDVKNKPSKEKPTIVVIHEHYRDGHAMYRCYETLIKGLQKSFTVIGVGEKGKVDKLGQKDADEFLLYDNIYEFEKIISDILSYKPDVLLYPSIGMSNFVPLLATQRLAPIQSMCLGHPSSSYFENIDFVHYMDLAGIDRAAIQFFLNEKIAPFEGVLTGMSSRAYTIESECKVDAEGKTHVAVNGVIQKVTSALLDICQRISDGSAKEVEFHFFMNNPKQDLDYFAAQSILRRYLPNSSLHMAQSYNDYMNTLAKCQFAIPTIPFGGSNSNIDCLKLRIPKLFIIDKSDMAGYTDYQIWNTLGILEGFCKNETELVERAVNYVNAPSTMSSYVQAIEGKLSQGVKFEINNLDADERLNDVIVKLLAD